MSIVAVHGPNTMFTTESGGVSIPSSGGGVAQATKSPTNGLVFTFSVPNPGARPAADFDWSFTGPGSPVAQPNVFGGTVTFTGPGAVTIVCLVNNATAPPPANGTYTVTATATAGTPRMVEQSAGGGYDPGEHTIAEVEDYVGDDQDLAAEVLAAEIAGKDRVTLVSYLQNLIPFDPTDHTIPEVEEYVTLHPEDLDRVRDAEIAGKNRSTLLSWLEIQGTA